MSNLYRSAIHARLSKLPPMPPSEEYENEDEGEEEADTLGSLPSTHPPLASLPKSGSRSEPPHLDTYKPTSASGYFDQALEINVPPVQLNFRVYYTQPKARDGAILVCHHGAGQSALSFACFAKEVTRLSNGECGILAFDVRRHGA